MQNVEASPDDGAGMNEQAAESAPNAAIPARVNTPVIFDSVQQVTEHR
jgi:hypothetical protein